MSENPSGTRLSYSVEDAAARCGWTRTRTFELIAQGVLRTYKAGRRRYVSEAALQDCIRRLEAATADGELPRPAKQQRAKKSSKAA